MRRFSTLGFTLGFCLSYPLIFARDWALVVYFPQPHRWHWGTVTPDVGPAMHWYGLLASATLAGLLAGMLCQDDALPTVLRRARWWPGLYAVLGAAYLLRGYFLG